MLYRKPILAATSTLGAALILSLPLLGTSWHQLYGSRLSGALAEGAVGDIRQVTVSPDGSRVLYYAGSLTDEPVELYSIPFDSSAPAVRLNDPLPGSRRVLSAQFTSDAAYVVFTVGEPTDVQGDEVYVAPVDGSQPPVNLTPFPLDRIYDWKISPDATRVLLQASFIPGSTSLLSVPLAGGPPVNLTPPGVSNDGGPGEAFAITHDSSTVVFLSNEFSDTKEVVRSAIDGGPRFRLGSPLSSPQAALSLKLSTDSTQVVYEASVDGTDTIELFSVRTDGSAPEVRLNPPLVAEGKVDRYDLHELSSRVLFTADAFTQGHLELFSVPITGGVVEHLNGDLTMEGPICEYSLHPSAGRVAFALDHDVYSVPVAGGQPALNLSNFPAEESYQNSLSIDPGGTNVAYVVLRDYSRSGYARELEVASLDGGQAPTRLISGQSVQAREGLHFTADGLRIVFLDLFLNFLYSVSIDGVEFVQLSTDSLFPGPVRGLVVHPFSSDVLYRGDDFVDGVVELFRVPGDGSALPTRIASPPSSGEVVGDVQTFRVSNDGSWTVYLADQDHDNIFELYSVPSDGSAPAKKLNGPTTGNGRILEDFVVSPDSRYVVYRGDQDVYRSYELYSVPVDGSGPPTQLNPLTGPGSSNVEGTDVEQVQVTPDSARVIYRAPLNSTLDYGLFVSPIDGSLPATRLDGPLDLTGHLDGVFDYHLDATGDRALYTQRYGDPAQIEIYSVAVDGTQAPTLLAGPVPLGPRSIRLGSTTTGRAIFTLSVTGSSSNDLYSVPWAGGQEATLLNAPLPAGGSVERFEVAAGGSHIIFLGDALADETFEIFCVPVDGSATQIRLNGPLSGSSTVTHFATASDGARVVYRANEVSPFRFDLFSVPTQGGAATQLNGSAGLLNPGLSEINPFQVTLDGQTVVYRSEEGAAGRQELYSVPIAGGSPPTKLHSPLPAEGIIASYRVGPHRSVLFSADLVTNDVIELFMVSLDAPVLDRRVHPAFPSYADIRPDAGTPRYQLLPCGQQVHYLADAQHNGAFELFTSIVTRPHRDRPSRGPEDGGGRSPF